LEVLDGELIQLSKSPNMKYTVGDSITPEQALDFALHLAEKGLGHVEPNPCVGCVVINEESQKLIAYGHHEKFGGPHAEVNALKNLESGDGLTLIVTLEPCAHYGKTPPCAELVASKKFRKVIYIDRDPNPKVSGKGLEVVKASGAAMAQAPVEFSKKNRMLNSKFFHAFEKEETFFHLKWAQSLDGKTSLNGQSKWITGEKARLYGHFLRAQSDAVLIGRETLEQDDPSLNIRLEGFDKPNKVIVFDPHLKSVKDLKQKKIFKIRPQKSVVYLCESPIESLDVDFVKLHKGKNGEYCLKRLAQDLFAQQKFQSVFVEGGASTLGAFLKQNVFGRLSVFTAPLILGAQASSPMDVMNFECIEDKKAFSVYSQKILGADTFVDLLV